MSFRARCPHCQKHATAPENALGKSLRCPSCHEAFTIAREPAPESNASPPEATAEASVLWEYRMEDLMEPAATSTTKSAAETRDALRLPIERRINALGAEGWELAAAAYTAAASHGLTEAIGFWKMIFKRPRRQR